MFKKAQQPPSSTGASILIIIIAVSILFYILFLPPEDRADLLENDYSNNGDGNSNLIHNLDGVVLVTENPGRLDKIKENEIRHDLGSFGLYSNTESAIIQKVDSRLISKSSFNEQSLTLDFKIDDKETIDNVLLSLMLNNQAEF